MIIYTRSAGAVKGLFWRRNRPPARGAENIPGSQVQYIPKHAIAAWDTDRILLVAEIFEGA